jgi:uncharacterized damage-inducible protein DinB
VPKWPWSERTFNFDFPATKFPDILERLRGTPARIAERIAGLDTVTLTRRDGAGWSIQENIGHLLDAEPLFVRRLDDLLAGESILTAADTKGRKTHDADHHAKPIQTLLAEFREQRGDFVARLEALDENDWSRSALHPRLQQPIRLVDSVYFHCEHDDYHLARISERIRSANPDGVEP